MSPSIFALFVLIPALFATSTRILTVFMVCCAFGSTAAIELTALGGAPITPAIFALPFLVYWTAKADGIRGLLAHLRYPSAGAWLVYLCTWGLLSAMVLPRIFFEDTYVFTTDRGAGALGVALVPLKASSSNLTQSCYALGGVVAFLAVRANLGQQGRLERFQNAVTALAAANILFACADLAEFYFHISLGLDMIRNANYAVIDGAEISGLVRIRGAFSETSAFAGCTAPIFVFMSYLWIKGSSSKLSGGLAIGNFLLLILSTSSTAYAALLIFFAWTAISRIVQIVLLRKEIHFGKLSICIWSVLVLLCLLVLLKQDYLYAVEEFLNLIVVKKLETTSGIERSLWNRQAFANFVETYGLGVGLGSARASSFPMVLISNLGVLGVLLFCGFLVQLFRGARIYNRFDKENVVARASLHAVEMSLIAASLAGTVFDLGMAFYGYAAASVAINRSAPDFETSSVEAYSMAKNPA